MARSETGRKGKTAAPLPEIPDKLYFRIGEVSRLLALPPYVLRFWETEFPHLKPGKGGTGQRLYRRRDVDALIEVRRLLYDEGYTIPGARQFLKEKARSPERALLPETDIESSDGAVSGAKLRQLKSGLREIADLLASPSTGQQASGNPAHRGLHLTPRKQAPRNQQPVLFTLPDDAPDDAT